MTHRNSPSAEDRVLSYPRILIACTLGAAALFSSACSSTSPGIAAGNGNGSIVVSSIDSIDRTDPRLEGCESIPVSGESPEVFSPTAPDHLTSLFRDLPW